MDSQGFGRCEKVDREFGNRPSCYVYDPPSSICRDLRVGDIPPMWTLWGDVIEHKSAEACESNKYI